MGDWQRNQLERDLWELGIVLMLIVIVFTTGWWLTARPRAQEPIAGPSGMIPLVVVPPPGADAGMHSNPGSTPPEAAVTILTVPRTCTLTVGPIAVMPWPAGYEGARVQITRNGSNHARSDATAPYGPFTATVDRGAWVLAATLSKSGLPAISVPLGTTHCGL